MARVFHRDDRTFSNFQEAELRKLCGVAQAEWPLYTAKELLDNAVAALEDSGHPAPSLTVTIDDKYIEIGDSGSGIPDSVLDQILDFSSFGGSNRHHKLPTRGAQGNAFMTVVGITSVWNTYIELGRHTEQTVRLTVKLDKVRQHVDVTREEISERPEGSFVRVSWPQLPVKRHGTTYEDIMTMVWMFARVNPHVTFTIKIRYSGKSSRHMFPAERGAKPAIIANSGSASWFTNDEFAERMAADIRARPDTKLSSWMQEFLGSKAVPAADAAIGEMVDDDKAALLTLATRLRAKIVASGSSVNDPKFSPVGVNSMAALLWDMGADKEAIPQYESRAGVFERSGAQIPYLVEACLVQMPKGSTDAPAPVLGMNRTMLYGSPQIDKVEYREKVRGDWHTTKGELSTYCHAYQIERGSTPAAVVVHITCPSPGYKSYGKQAFDTDWLSKPLAECMERVTLECRKQRAGESRRKNAGAEKEDSILETLLEILPGVHTKLTVTRFGTIPILIRALYYGVRGVWEKHHSADLQYATFCAYVDIWEERMGKPMVLKDPRGTLLEPHSGRSLRLGTSEVADYTPKKWEGHTIIFVEKENFAHILRKYGIMKRWDAIVIGSKGFAVDACREVLQKYKQLLGSMVKIICLHDGDPAGYMIGHDLATNLPRFGQNVDVQVIDVGLTIAEGEKMGLMTEPFELKKANWRMVHNMRSKMIRDQNGRRPLLEPAAWDAFMPRQYRTADFPDWDVDSKGALKQRGRRIELNAMEPEVFIDWLEGHLDRNGCKKVRPPDDIVNAELLNARHNKVHTEVGNMLMKILGNDIVLGIMAEIGVPSYDLDSVLAGRPEQHWQYLVQRAGQTGVDFEQAVKRAIIKTRPDLAGLLG
jgi:hypothetical protein